MRHVHAFDDVVPHDTSTRLRVCGLYLVVGVRVAIPPVDLVNRLGGQWVAIWAGFIEPVWVNITVLSARTHI